MPCKKRTLSPSRLGTSHPYTPSEAVHDLGWINRYISFLRVVMMPIHSWTPGLFSGFNCLFTALRFHHQAQFVLRDEKEVSNYFTLLFFSSFLPLPKWCLTIRGCYLLNKKKFGSRNIFPRHINFTPQTLVLCSLLCRHYSVNLRRVKISKRNGWSVEGKKYCKSKIHSQANLIAASESNVQQKIL